MNRQICLSKWVALGLVIPTCVLAQVVHPRIKISNGCGEGHVSNAETAIVASPLHPNEVLVAWIGDSSVRYAISLDGGLHFTCPQRWPYTSEFQCLTDGSHKRLYVTGKTQRSAGDFDMVTLKYDTLSRQGGFQDQLWGPTAIWNYSAQNGNDASVSVYPVRNMLGQGVNVFRTGPSDGGSTGSEWVTQRISDAP